MTCRGCRWVIEPHNVIAADTLTSVGAKVCE
jgi:hypothetical protein